MNQEIDNEIKELLLKSMASAKEHRAKQEQKRKEKLWEEINVPCRLEQIINRLSKQELDNIRKRLGLKNLSTLKKQDLAKELIKLMPEQSKRIFMLFDKGRYYLAKRISKNGGFVYESGLTLEKIEYLREQGIIFSGSKDGKKILFMPLEILEIFREIDTPELKKIVSRNTEWISLSQGILYYYGVVHCTKLEEMIEKLSGERPDTTQYLGLLFDAAEYYAQIKPNDAGFGFCNARVFDPQVIMREHNARPGVDYYPFTKGQLLQAGEEGYIDRTPALKRFLDFLLHHYEITREEADEIAVQCTNLIQSDSEPDAIIEYLGTQLEFPSFDMVQQLTGEIMNLSNNTRMWILKGHTPQELFQEEKKHLRPLPSTPLTAGEAGGKVVDIKTRRTKVGRNEPCPCGSGKKYKKCCGK